MNQFIERDLPARLYSFFFGGQAQGKRSTYTMIPTSVRVAFPME